MKNLPTSAKGAQKATVLTNEVANKTAKEEFPALILLPDNETKKVKTKDHVETKAKTRLETEAGTKRLTIDELTDKADRIYLLRQKYQEIREKRKQLESFTISHDNNNAQLNLVDAKGLSIATSNPSAINKLLSDWMVDLNEHLEKTEKEIRSEIEILQ